MNDSIKTELSQALELERARIRRQEDERVLQFLDEARHFIHERTKAMNIATIIGCMDILKYEMLEDLERDA